jgi:hypothetical protein
VKDHAAARKTLNRLFPIARAAYGRGVLVSQCWSAALHVPRNSDDERGTPGTPAAFPALAWRPPAYQHAQCSNDWSAGHGCVTLPLHPGLESFVLRCARPCLSRAHLSTSTTRCHTVQPPAPDPSVSAAATHLPLTLTAARLRFIIRKPRSPAHHWTMTAISTREYPHRRPLFCLRT